MRKQQEQGTVVVLGATGGTGYHIVQELLRQGTSVRVLSCEREKTKSLLGDAVEIAVADVTVPKSLRGPFADAEAVIVTIRVKPGRVCKTAAPSVHESFNSAWPTPQPAEYQSGYPKRLSLGLFDGNSGAIVQQATTTSHPVALWPNVPTTASVQQRAKPEKGKKRYRE